MRRRFQAAPTGSSIGLYLSAAEEISIAIVVYPKFWQSAPRAQQVRWAESANHLAVSCAEGDILEIDAVPERLALFDKPVRRTGGSRNDLIVPLRGLDVEGDARTTPTAPRLEPVDALLGIEALIRQTGLGMLFAYDLGLIAPHLRDPLLRPLLYRYFVQEVEQNILHARREYVWREEISPVVRGRPDPVSIFVHSRTGWPQLRCRFQDFTRETPTLMAICAALDYVANDGATFRGPFASIGEIRDDAIRLRRLLPDVPRLTQPSAVRAATSAVRDQRAGHWKRALELAIGVLWPRAGSSLGGAESALEITVDSSRVWELILLRIFRSGHVTAYDGNGNADMPLAVNRPWVGLGVQPPRPDFLLNRGDRWVVGDAKYKDLAGVPAIDDLYQMFAYSYLSRVDDAEQISDLALIYPVRSEEEVGVSGPYQRFGDESAKLVVRRMRFPSPAECRGSWASYVRGQAERLGPTAPVASART